MAQKVSRVLAAAIGLWLLGGAAARAEFMDWSYAWGGSPVSVPANGGAQNGTVNFTLPPAASSPVALSVAADSGFTDQYSNDPFSLTFTVTDTDHSQSANPLTVNGQFNGTVTQNAVNMGITFEGSNSTFAGTDTQTFDFLGHRYSVTFGSTQTAGPPGTAPGSWTGAITASVNAVDIPVDGPPPTITPPANNTPEPTSLVLAGLALPALGLTGWMRRRKAAAGAA